MHLAVGVAVKAGGSRQSAAFVKLDLLLLENLKIIVTITNAALRYLVKAIFGCTKRESSTGALTLKFGTDWPYSAQPGWAEAGH
jgi:hypothetical protein